MRAMPANASSTTQSILASGMPCAASVTAGHWCTTSPSEDVLMNRIRLLRAGGVDETLVGSTQSFVQRNAWLPAERAHQGGVKELLRRAVGLGAVIHDLRHAAERIAHCYR